ncbi:MAG: gliding motility-associated C-terminal domain-containing protein [Bacteroidetes bacterium]|nr:gliding motility-associated C-terminal domain-containing protein [Bacteroidota bacterium]
MGNPNEINNLDDFLRDQLDGFAPEPPSGVFSSIEQSVSNQTGIASKASLFSKGIVKLVTIMATTATISVAGYFIVNKSQDVTADEVKQSVSNESNPNQLTDLLPPESEQATEKTENSGNMQSSKSPNAPVTVSSPKASVKDGNSKNDVTTPSNTLNSDSKNTTSNSEKTATSNSSSQQTRNKKEDSNNLTNTNPAKNKVVDQPKALFVSEWVDENKLRLINKSIHAQNVIWLINGRVADLKVEDETILSIDKDNLIKNITVIAKSDSYIDSFTQIIKYNQPERMILPNVFTPDGDGMNDSYEVYVPFPTELTQMQVYNLAGTLVYAGNQKDWDGNINGVSAPSGIYQVIFTYKTIDMEVPKVKKQQVELIRK